MVTGLINPALPPSMTAPRFVVPHPGPQHHPRPGAQARTRCWPWCIRWQGCRRQGPCPAWPPGTRPGCVPPPLARRIVREYRPVRSFLDHPTSACLDFKKQVRMEADKQPRMDTNGRGCESGKIADCPEISVLIRVHPWFKLFSWFAASGRVLNGWHLGSEMVPRILDRARFGHPVQLVILSRILVRVGPRRGDRSSDRNFPDEPNFGGPARDSRRR